MNRIIRKICDFFTSDEAATSVEYAVVIGLIILVCMSAISVFGSKTNESLSHSAASLPNPK